MKGLEYGELNKLDPENFDVKLIKKYLLIKRVNKYEEQEAAHLDDFLLGLTTKRKKTI